MGGAEVEPLIRGLHLGTHLRGADALKLHHEQVKLQDELPNVLILPHALVYPWWHLADFGYLAGVISDELLEIFLHSERSSHLGDVLLLPDE